MQSAGDVELPKPKWKRVSKPKTRTGCLTCRTRRVKCDENRPGCLRCARLGYECGGYPSIDKDNPKPRPVTAIHRLLPKVQYIEGQPVLHPRPQRTEQLASYGLANSTFSDGFMNAQDGYYFRSYQQDIAFELSGGFESQLWSRIILQACENMSIRYLTIAIAAVKRIIHTEPSRLDEIESHRRYAFQKYSQALKSIQKHLSHEQENIRLALLAALLIFVFEALLGRTRVAVKQVQSALGLIKHQLGRDPKNPDLVWTNMNLGTSPPAALAFVEGEVVKSFMRLERPGIRLLGTNKGAVSVKNRLFRSIFLKDYEIPKIFSSLDEARHYFECIHFRSFPEDNLEAKVEASTTLKDGNASPAMLITHLLSQVPQPLAASLRKEVARWHRAFAPLLHHSRTQKGASTFVLATTLSIQTAAIGVSACSVSIASSDAPLVVEESLRAAQNILSKARALVAHPKFTRSFVFDVGIIPSLWIIMVFCFDISLRKEALAILRSMQPRIECVWDSKDLADKGEEILRMME